MENYLIVIIVGLTCFLWIWATYDLNKTRSVSTNKRLFWLFSFYTLPIIAPIVYFQVKRKYIVKRK